MLSVAGEGSARLPLVVSLSSRCYVKRDTFII
jgi:hypothetical protein